MYSNNDLLQNVTKTMAPGTKILIATFPGDGHFNPLTGIGAHLKAKGYDVRWYTSVTYQAKVEKLGIPFYRMKKALDITGDTIEKIFPGREACKSPVSKLNFDITNVFILRGPEYYQDIMEIHNFFPFKLMIADIAFTGIPFVKDLMGIPVAGVGVFPLTRSSKDLPPAGLGMTPSYSIFGKLKQHFLRFAARHILFAKSNKVMRRVFAEYGIECSGEFVFDEMQMKCDLLLQSGTPGFEYKRSDLEDKVKFVGPLLPYMVKKNNSPWFDERLNKYNKIVLATQGTVEKDSSKLLVPTLEALKNTEYLVVITTGGSDTERLRRQYEAPNVIIEDFIPFDDIMPFADVYVTNGGMGGVMLSIENKLPMVMAGVHEGKNEICARAGYFNLAVNLKTERPTALQIRRAVDEVTGNEIYRKNISALSEEFSTYNSLELCEYYLQKLLPSRHVRKMENVEEGIY
jgi:UDP:flavonoid glycosyltransferase YjiC (YdhE family)